MQKSVFSFMKNPPASKRYRASVPAGDILGRFSLGPSWCRLWPPWRRLGPSWRRLGSSWRHLGAVLGRLGAVLVPSCAVLGCLGAVLAPSWAVLGLSWRRLGALMEPSWVVLGRGAFCTANSKVFCFPDAEKCIFLYEKPTGEQTIQGRQPRFRRGISWADLIMY